MSERLYLLDTNILLALIRGGDLGHRIEKRFRLRSAKQKPLISVVSCGEIRVLADRNGWGEAKRSALDIALASVVVVDLNHPDILDAYVRFEAISQQNPSGARNMGKNDLWIAACAAAAQAFLLTTDGDFDHLIPDHLTGEIVPP